MVFGCLLGTRALAADPAPPPQRETAKEFLDSQADSAIAPDPSQIYRRNGNRREVDIARGLVASLDELAPTRLGTGVSIPGVAGAPGRTLALALRRDPWSGDLWYQKRGAGRDAGLSAAYAFSPRWQIRSDGRERRNDDLLAKRRDEFYGLRYMPAPNSAFDLGVHRARHRSDDASLEQRANFARAQARWQPADVENVGLHVAAEHPIGTQEGDPAFTRGRIEVGADYRLGPQSALPGSLLYWREAPRLGLLSEGEALELRAAYKRTIGIEMPDGSPGGTAYTQFQQRSLADDRDALWVVGWRHRFRLDPRWTLDAHAEQATPIAGPSAVRSFIVGGRLYASRFPRDSFAVDFDVVDAQTRDSFYSAAKYTARLSGSVLSDTRISFSRGQAHGDLNRATNEWKAALALGWREPEARRLSVLGRHTWIGRSSDEAGITDRRARIVLGYLGYTFDATDALSARLSRRWDHDELYPPDNRRLTDFALVRIVHDLNRRWSLSAHVARRNDSVFGNENSAGIEIGYKLSSRAVLALGYNPIGFNDNEISVDERPRRGVNLRLRFFVDSALSRWLDAPARSAPEASSIEQLPAARTADAPLR